MLIHDVLRAKGGPATTTTDQATSRVTTVTPGTTVRDLIAQLARHNFGALVVTSGGGVIEGIVSERDVVRRLHERGAELLDAQVSEIMTREVRTCHGEDEVADLRQVMTEHRIRHLPVVRDGLLVDIVSIGDIVKASISELETEKEHLVEYLQS
jgi:CBS domain-containing protein